MIKPIFLVAVPRSGSTLLRMILDSHRHIFSGPEAPWLGGTYRENGFEPEVSLRCLFHRLSMTSDLSTEKSALKRIFRQFIESIIEPHLQNKSVKCTWVEKTPDNIIQIPFLKKIFPEAKFIHLLRDGRDVALSTTKVHWRTLNYFIEPGCMRYIPIRRILADRLACRLPKQLQELFPRNALSPPLGNHGNSVFYPIANTYANALHRWRMWTIVFSAICEKHAINQITVKYEDLVREPSETLDRIFSFIGLAWNPEILNYRRFPHVNSNNDVGANSALSFTGISSRNCFKWKRDLSWLQRYRTKKSFDPYLTELGYEPTK